MTTIYRLIEISTNKTFYIGMSINTARRYREHLKSFKKTKDEIMLLPICRSADWRIFYLEWYFIDLLRNEKTLVNRSQFFTRKITDELTFTDFCLKYGVKQVEILDFSIFSK